MTDVSAPLTCPKPECLAWNPADANCCCECGAELGLTNDEEENEA